MYDDDNLSACSPRSSALLPSWQLDELIAAVWLGLRRVEQGQRWIRTADEGSQTILGAASVGREVAAAVGGEDFASLFELEAAREEVKDDLVPEAAQATPTRGVAAERQEQILAAGAAGLAFALEAPVDAVDAPQGTALVNAEHCHDDGRAPQQPGESAQRPTHRRSRLGWG